MRGRERAGARDSRKERLARLVLPMSAAGARRWAKGSGRCWHGTSNEQMHGGTRGLGTFGPLLMSHTDLGRPLAHALLLRFPPTATKPCRP